MTDDPYPGLRRLGVLLYGNDRFGSQMAADLSDIGPRKVDQSQISQWLTGRRDVPDWLPAQCRALALKGQQDLAQRLGGIAALLADTQALDTPARRHSRLAKLRQAHPDDRPEDPGPPEELPP